MFLVAQKWRSSIVVGTIRLLSSEDDVRVFFAALKTLRTSGLWGEATKTGSGMIHDTRYWYVWKVAADEEPELCEDLLKEVR